MAELPVRPQIYSRPWHLDLDDRRHQGQRCWDRAALERVIGLISQLDFLYPPDWSDKDVIRFRAPGQAVPMVEIRTDDPQALHLRVEPIDSPGVDCSRGAQCHLTISNVTDADGSLPSILSSYAEAFRAGSAS